MEFEASFEIAAPRAEVLAAMGEPTYYEHLATRVTSIEQPELLHTELTDGVLHLSVRYAFSGDLSGPAKMVIDSSKLTWTINTVLDLATHRAVLDIVPDHYGDLVVAEAAVTFEERGTATIESIAGSLEVKIPLFGAAAERAIVDGLLRHLGTEAQALAEYCAAGS